jgi:hypothetical protein
MFVSSLGTFGGWPSGADGALIFGDVVVVHAPALRLRTDQITTAQAKTN